MQNDKASRELCNNEIAEAVHVFVCFLFVRNKKYGQPEYDSLTLPHTYHRPGLLPDPIDYQYINIIVVARPLTYLAK